MTILIPDTTTMEAGNAVVFPSTDITRRWKDEALADVTALYNRPGTTMPVPAETQSRSSNVIATAPKKAGATETFLLTWNSGKWDGDIEEEFISEVVAGNPTDHDCSTGRVTSAIGRGDEVYLLRQGPEPRGIIAFGTVTSEVWRDEHWDEDGRRANYVDVRWTHTPFPSTIRFRSLNSCFMLHAPQQHWKPQGSGSRLRDVYTKTVSQLWEKYVEHHR